MIVSVRQWTFLRSVQRAMRALTHKTPAKSLEERKPSRGFLAQFEEMMAFQTHLVLRNMDRD
ncbi:MAG: hypothetical protein ACO1SV_13735 [Fimbriimonas sp.]